MKTLFNAFFLLLFLSTSVQANPEKTILVMGDSLSAGYGLDASAGWVSLLRQRLQQNNHPYQVVNASITGDTTQGGLARLPKTLKREQPAIVVLELGGNDGLRGFSLKLTRDNLRRMIKQSMAADARVLLLGVQLPANYGNRFRKQFQQIYLDLADQQNIAAVPFFLEGVAETPALMQPDGIHPSAAAQERILDNVWAALEPLL